MTKKQTQIIAIGALMAVALVAAAFFLGIKPQLARAAAANTERDAALAEQSSLEVVLADLQAKQAGLGTAQKAYKSLAAQFPEEFGISSWLNMVTAAANDAGVALVDIQPGLPTVGTGTTADAAVVPVVPVAPAPADGQTPIDPATGAPVAAAPVSEVAYSQVTMSAEGSTAEIRRFVALLATMERPLLIDSLSYTGQGNSVVSITGKTFLLKALPTLETAAAAAEEGSEPAADSAAGAAGTDTAAGAVAVPAD